MAGELVQEEQGYLHAPPVRHARARPQRNGRPSGPALPASWGLALPLGELFRRPLAALLFLSGAFILSAAASRPPNFIFILTDDLGWTDLGCQGSTFYETPHLDRLAREGMRFTQAYSACTVCSPTRASILTGQYPARLHVTDWIEGHKRPYARLQVPDWTMHLPLEAMNLARALGGAGYVSASIGKWHLGAQPFWPERQGFAVNLGGCDRGQPPSYFSPYRIPTLTDGPVGEFLTDRECAEALRFVEQNRDRPFFLYLAHHAVHTPLMGKSNVVEKYRARAQPGAPQRNPLYAALIESVDDSVGRLLGKLDNLRLADKTVVFFTSDNGGLVLNDVTSNLPLRAGKGSAYEGGVRVPLLVRWPGFTQAGSLCTTPVISADVFPTLLGMAGRSPPRGHPVDGESLVPLLRQSGGLKRTSIFWHYPHYHPGGATPYSAVRNGDWKLIEFLEDHRTELYNLKEDIAEKTDLAATLPKKRNELLRVLQGWRRKVGAQMPAPNPDYDPASDRYFNAPRQTPSSRGE
jgi:arylsulfatase A